MSDSSVITKEEGWIKRGYSSDYSRPKFAIMNPELTMTLPDYQTACGCTDILMHTLERYFTQGGNMEITDAVAEMAHKCAVGVGGAMGSARLLNESDMLAIYKACR